MAEPPRAFVYLAAPCYGGRLTIHFANSILALAGACEARGIGLHVELLANDALIPRARARLAARFLAHAEATHILYCDVDIGFRPENAFRLLDARKEIAAGIYPLKAIDWERVRAAAMAGAADLQAAALSYVVRFLPTADRSVEVDDGFARVAYGGGGFLLIRREALQRIAAAHPELVATLDDGAQAVMVFDPMVEPETGEHLSEDYAFCRRWRELGGEIWADVESRLTHVGHAAYSGALIRALRPA
ncbi:MAG TPA: hypothetical protein VLI41_05670 [Phenylobacterium sp.]|uniref:hypothetical protein n=1 Tax=Phenylobacterium sp. TaxID=1871053 RepID=UPI002BA9416F|nr:hypothetical protein [Phenylobacterium sp.]HSV02676.1 hypothetical protein [Phenylobacterium sp.]